MIAATDAQLLRRVAHLRDIHAKEIGARAGETAELLEEILRLRHALALACRTACACTDCGADTRALREQAYQLRPSIWELAFPGYRKGAGVGDSRPCIGCLEERLGRHLKRSDFTKGDINHPDPLRHGFRLLLLLRQPQTPPAAPDDD